jgi:hypothetical protein
MSIRRVAVLALLCCVCPAAAARDVPKAYASIRDQLRLSAVPVLLPVPVPPAIQPSRSFTVLSADRSGYAVGFSPRKQCYEALSCAFFHVAGFTRTALPDRSYRKDRSVRLSDGTRGYFRPQDCSGASCAEATLTFEHYGAIYELAVKAGRDDLRVLKDAYRNLRIVR